MSAPNFRFELGQTVLFKTKQSSGPVAARGEFLDGGHKYLVQLAAGAIWINDGALDVPPPPPLEQEGEAEA